jgi:methenyltetrahydromethanopterin cyclohydrolase
MLDWRLNERALRLLEQASQQVLSLRISVQVINGATVFDAGVHSQGGLEAGLLLARVCLAGLARVELAPGEGEMPWPMVSVFSDQPVIACLASQYAGWQIQKGKYFAMASGPMRAIYAGEKIFEEIGYRERSAVAVGVLETNKLPSEEVVSYLAEKLQMSSHALRLLVAPTASQAGMLQIAARSVETALHKLHELGYPLSEIVSGFGTAPLLPPPRDPIAAIGRSNDAILYGARVWLWVRSEDERIAEIGPRVPSAASPDFGRPFQEIFQRYGGDFYRIDPMLFSPAEVHFYNLQTGRHFRFGQRRPDILQET